MTTYGCASVTDEDSNSASEFAARISSLADGQPIVFVERDGVHYVLLGTAHVSQSSAEAVTRLSAEGGFDAIAVELDEHRKRALLGEDDLSHLDILSVIRSGKAAMIAAHLALAAYHRRLAEQLGVEAGAELKAACVSARIHDKPLLLIDREVGITLRRALAALGFWARAKLSVGLGLSLFFSEEVQADEIERLKEGDLLDRSFGAFATQNPLLYRTLIEERDRYMAARLRSGHGHAQRVLVVIGAGHLEGVAAALRNGVLDAQEECATLDEVPRGSRLPWFGLALIAFLVAGFAWGIARGDGIGLDLALSWVLATAGLGALGCAVAGGHPLSILTALLVSPLTPLHPALSSGMASAAVEGWLRKPTYRDFLYLRDDTTHWSGWWRNRVARLLVNFLLTNLGTALGVWLGGAAILGTLL